MAEAVIMPKTGMAMEEGVIVEWLVKEGDKVSAGDPIAEIETDKSSMELESDCDGTILRILYENGTTVPVVETIAWIGKPGEALPDDTAGDAGKIKATPAARRAAAERNLQLENIQPGGRYGEIKETDVLGFSRIQPKLTPLTRRITESENVNLKDVKGSGHDGKIFSADLVKTSRDTRVPLSTVQKITGKRMLMSHLEIPVVSMDTQADVTELLKIRKQLNASLEHTIGNKITINDFVLKATGLALAENPRLNSVIEGNDVIYKSLINLNMAVATEKGLLVPVIKEVDKLTIRQLSLKTAEIADRARMGKLSPDEMEGGTFTVSNIGIFGITSFTPIINQPQAAILGVCAIDEKLKLINQEVQARQMMNLSISFDHRIVDGAEASGFFSRIRELLENPLVILA